MQKSTSKLTKENQELRRQLEILKAQAKIESKPIKENITNTTLSQKPQEVIKPSVTEAIVSTQYVKKDLLKTIILSGIIFTVIFGIYFSGKFS